MHAASIRVSDNRIPKETKDLLPIKDNARLRRITDQIRELKQEGYTLHVTD